MTMLTTTRGNSGSTRPVHQSPSLSLKRSSSYSSSPLNWKTLPYCSLARQDAASTFVPDVNDGKSSHKLIIVGGRSAIESSLADVELFDCRLQKWESLPSLSTTRCGCSVASMDERVYAFGGLSGTNERLKSCESLEITGINTDDQPRPDSWRSEPDMSSPRWYGAAAAFPLHGNIVVLGGRDDTWQELASVEAFDTRTKEWHTLCPMSVPRFGCGATRISPSKLLVAGGFNGESWLNSAEIYDYELDDWTPIRPMPEAIEFCTVESLDAQLVLVSGKGHKKNVKFFVYNTLEKTWFTVKPSFRLEGAVVATVGSNVLAVDQFKHTRVTTNLLSLFRDDITEGTSQSSLSHDDDETEHGDTTTTRSSNDYYQDDEAAPWWTSTPSHGERPALVIPQNEHDQISVLAEDDEYATTSVHPLKMATDSSPTQRWSNRIPIRRGSVKNHGMEDSFGHKILYSGKISDSNKRPHGKGTVQWLESGDVYMGSLRQGHLEGSGVMNYGNGDTYEGDFRRDARHGHGSFRWDKDGRTYEGSYEEDLPHDSNGCMTWGNGTVFMGTFVKGKRTGNGVQRFPSGLRYQGEFWRGKYNGFGVCEFADGSVYKGQWTEGKAHGQGRLVSADGDVLHEGEWESDGPKV